MNPAPATLAWVNVERTKRGVAPLASLPKGVCAQAEGCPIARAFAALGRASSTNELNTVFWHALDGRPECIRHPQYVAQFIRAFDAGEYPELVA